MVDPLRAEAENFAGHLADLIQGCIKNAPDFEIIEAGRGQRLRIGPSPCNPDNTGFSFIPLERSCESGDRTRMMLKVEFTVSLDDASEFLAVQHSIYGLWVRPDPDPTKIRPVFRIEYDRDAHRKPPAHVHVHAESMELGWIYGTAGLPLSRLSEIHFPVGGRRFRPTIEEFIQFLDQEELYTDWQQGWQDIIGESLKTWRRIQTKANVRRETTSAIQQLEDMGYTITPPCP